MKTKKPWSGRFKEQTDKLTERFTSSLSFDVRLWRYDIQGSSAHAAMLARQNIITYDEKELIVKGLKEIENEIEEGTFIFQDELEDVHMNIEAALIEKIGSVGGKLHTARSRNDQVLVDLKLYLKDEINSLGQCLKNLKATIVEIAEKYSDIIIPGYTHLQRAQPVLLSHHLLAYWEMLNRDDERIKECLTRVDVLPLGACALAGTSLPIDRQYVAEILGFSRYSKNSMDTVSDRDFALEFLCASSIIMSHLSRFAEDIILWSTWEFGFADLPDAYSTGSSIMPQKKNPDIAELIRGKSGRVYGNMISLFTTVKGLPMGYNRDLQEDKEPLFDTADTVKSCLEILTAMLPHLKFHKSIMKKAAEGGFSTATDFAEYLVKKGVPFREAHEITGHVVSYCIDNRKVLTDLTLDELKQFTQKVDHDITSVFLLEKALNSKNSAGGTSSEQVQKRINEIKKTS
jgi:argininosuccinate lyase